MFLEFLHETGHWRNHSRKQEPGLNFYMRLVKSYMRRLRKTTKQPAGWPETISNEPELPNPSPDAQFIWDVYETHTENNLDLKWGRDAIPKCPQIRDATANFATLPRNLYETKLSHIKTAQVYMRQHVKLHLHFLTTLPSKNTFYMRRQRETRRAIWQYLISTCACM